MLLVCSFGSIDNVQQLVEVGLFVGDLNTFDSSRDFVFNGMNRSSTLEYLIEQVLIYSFKYSRVRNTIHENVVFRVYRYKHDPIKYKHDTNTKKFVKFASKFLH